jgi:type II secretory ATPase GspE/PulE/Tfp pilus assembly ATPase PilB-like protein
VDCREEYHPEAGEFDDLVHAYGADDFEKLGVKYEDDFVLYRGKGCASCDSSGYRGRAGIHELLVATDPVKKLIQSRARVVEMVKVAKDEGMTTLVQDGILKALDGLTDLKQVKAVAIK